MNAQRGSKDTVLPNLNLGGRWGWMVSATFLPLYPRERAPLQIVQEAGWNPGLFWTCVEKGKSLSPTGVLTLNRPACSEALYFLFCSVCKKKLRYDKYWLWE